MNYPAFFDVKNSLKLFGFKQEFDFLIKLYYEKKLPKVLLLTGNKGSGKATLVNHFLISIFDKKNYNFNKNNISKNSDIYNQLSNNIFSNIIYLYGSDYKSVKIEDLRNLKKKIFQSTILNKDRFIVFDDVELFNNNSLNALLKIIEEPSKNNYFILINNKSKPLLETIKSRSIEIKLTLNEKNRLNIINDLIKFFELNTSFNPNLVRLSPGNFIKFDYLCRENNISINEKFIDNLFLLLNLYKKNKDIIFIDMAFFITDYYLKSLIDKKIFNNDEIFEIKDFIYNNFDRYIRHNINLNSFINTVSSKLK